MTRTEAERLTRIEVLLETMAEAQDERRREMHDKITEMAGDIKAIKSEMEAVKAEHAALKNKGAGILIGVGLAGGAVGAGMAEFFGGLFQ